MSTKTHILKFGGSSLKNRSFIEQSVQIVMDRLQTAQPYVVVSAIGGVTDALISIADDTASQSVKAHITELRKLHLDLFDGLVAANDPRRNKLLELFDELEGLVQSNESGEKSFAKKDRILSIGERASALIFAATLTKRGVEAQALEAHQFIKTDSTFGQAEVETETTRKLVRKFLHDSKAIPVITGFIGSDSKQRITTLGRSGSDYTAGLIASALDADHLEIWTDVNGVLTADPRWVPTAQNIEQLSFEDISELSAHGANVIHPKTISPIRDKATSVLVKNSQNPAHPGTWINSNYSSNGALKTITVTGPFVWLQVDDQYAYPLFEQFREWQDYETDPEAIAFKRNSGFEPARFLLRESFYQKIETGLELWFEERNLSLDPEKDIFKVKKFSNHFSKDEHLTDRISNLFASKKLSPLSVERNQNERFISFLFKRGNARRAARLLNDYLQHEKTVVDLFVAGTGAVGQTLLEQLKEINPERVEFRLLGVCNSRHSLWDDNGLDLHSDLDWSENQPTDWDLLTENLTQDHRHNLIFVDATGSSEVARFYPKFFKNGIHIVTPSKLANTFEQSFFDELQSIIENNNISFRYETTVGAALPVISTINDMQTGGDKITEISGVVSGTMTYLFNQLEKGVSFSKAIADARELGYAEPDPRDDLSGEDVARKFLTLARTMGLKIERDELEVESLIPEPLRDVEQSVFLDRLAEYDTSWQEKLEEAQKRNETLRYVGKLADGKISIGIKSVPINSPIGQLKGTDNLFQIYSSYYNKTPLVIQGPGAGKEITAAGVLSDILKTAEALL
jgi:aspartokinase/homoserine dehydrogenase 1